MARKGRHKAEDPAAAAVARALGALEQHPLFAPLLGRAYVSRREGNGCPAHGWALVTHEGNILLHPTRRAEADVWTYVIAHTLLHLGFGHLRPHENAAAWNAACDLVVARFLASLKLGRPPEPFLDPDGIPAHDEERLYARFCETGVPEAVRVLSTAGAGVADMDPAPARLAGRRQPVDWQAAFGKGLAAAVRSAVNVAAGIEDRLGSGVLKQSAATRARRWFMDSYPLLGALAAAFDLVEDPIVCARLQIAVAAVDAESREVFINPAAGLDEHESRFVMAHELLHVGLRHLARRRGRDPFLWNVACDYVVNGWLVELWIGEMPPFGLLHDPDLKGLSAEAIYDQVVTDLRRARRLATLRGTGLGDMLERGVPDWWTLGEGMDLDAFYRRCLAQGLVYHEAEGRGFLPAGLVEEIRALGVPPIPWDVELAKWFDDHFQPLEHRRTYARPSRRQSATPDIPRPSWTPVPRAEDGRTFGVVLDTSGSMDRSLLAKALGAIASYSLARDVPAVRVLFCDAAPYDAGYMPPEDITGRVQVRGRGGTVLQPGIDLLDAAPDFPNDGPLLIITDGQCDRLRVRRDHAFLIPEGRHLPFVPKGPVFRLR